MGKLFSKQGTTGRKLEQDNHTNDSCLNGKVRIALIPTTQIGMHAMEGLPCLDCCYRLRCYFKTGTQLIRTIQEHN